MKKLALVQVLLGVLIIGSLLFWLLVVLDGYFKFESITPQGDIGLTAFVNPGQVTPVSIWIVFYFILGILVTGFGIAQYISARRREKEQKEHGTGHKLVTTQIIMGTLVVVSLICFIGWIEFDYSGFTVPRDNIEFELKPAPGWYAAMVSWKVVSFILGLSAAGCGVIQLMKTRALVK